MEGEGMWLIKRIFTVTIIAFLLLFSSSCLSRTIESELSDFEWLNDREKLVKIYEEMLRENEYEVEMLTSGTEYIQGDDGKVFVRLLDGNSKPVNFALCNATIYYPNNTKFVDGVSMTLLGSGVYYYDLTIPQVLGNYIVLFDCVIPSIPFVQNVSLEGILIENFDSFEVEFGFDNTNNLTINYAYLEVLTHGTSAQSILGVNFNGKYLGQIEGQNPPLANYTLNQSDFYLTEEQTLVLTDESLGGNSYMDWVRLVVSYDWEDPSQLSRGQDELHVRDPCEERILCLLQHSRILNERIVNFHNTEYCIGNNTLRHNITYEYCIGGNCKILSDIMDEECVWGCDIGENRCRPSPLIRAGIGVFVFLALIILTKVVGLW